MYILICIAMSGLRIVINSNPNAPSGVDTAAPELYSSAFVAVDIIKVFAKLRSGI